MSSLSLEELHTFYSIEREVFSRMVLTLMRDPAESVLVIATWLWLEELDFPNILPKMTNFPDELLKSLSDEAVSCLRCLQSLNPPTVTVSGLPLTSLVMDRDLSLCMIYHNKYGAISGIKNILETVCSRAFSDILQSVLGAGSFHGPNTPLTIPGFPHPVFGNIVVLPSEIHAVKFPGGPDEVWRWDMNSNITEKDRTMFLTFSRGFPVTEEEVKELFTGMYGENCVEGVHMQESGESGEQPLFAEMVLDSITTVDHVLCGRHIAKFRVNGKHLWARKYERRHESS